MIPQLLFWNRTPRSDGSPLKVLVQLALSGAKLGKHQRGYAYLAAPL
jgi:hypothetical protein